MKVCVNGGRDGGDHPGIPLTPAELAVSAAEAVAAGAEAVHMHPRDGSGAESLAAADIAAAVTAVRHRCPGVTIGVSTGLWITRGDPRARSAEVAGWASLPVASRPDFASVNVSEPGWPELCGQLSAAGIGAEAGVWSVDDAYTLVAGTGTVDWLRILVEVIDSSEAGAAAAADEILSCLGEVPAAVPRLLHGEGPSCWPLIAYAGWLGIATRVGLEDTLAGPDGFPVTSNADLVSLALPIWSHH